MPYVSAPSSHIRKRSRSLLCLRIFSHGKENISEELWQSWHGSGDVAHPKDTFVRSLRFHYESLKTGLKSYAQFSSGKHAGPLIQIKRAHEKARIYGDCPARSEKTVCCNLRTLDLVLNCGFGCSYCSIQTFSERAQSTIYFHQNLDERLE